jgi:nitroreductase
MMAHDVLHTIRTRRVTRDFREQPVSQDALRQILEAARWAPSAGNRRLQRFIAIQDPTTIRLVRTLAPGMLGHPSALVVICIDWARAAALGCKPHHTSVYIDVGTAAENMLLACHALGLGCGPVTSFSKEGVRTVLRMPATLSPEMIVCVGHRAETQRYGPNLPPKPTRLEDLVYWETVPEQAT